MAGEQSGSFEVREYLAFRSHMSTPYACCYCCWQLYLASKEYGATAASDPTLASEAHVCHADILATAHQLTRYLCGKNESDSQPCFPSSPDAYCCCIMTQQNACYTPAMQLSQLVNITRPAMCQWHAAEQSQGFCKHQWLLLSTSPSSLMRSMMNSRQSCATKTAKLSNR